MSEHRAKLTWERDGLEFTYKTYSRAHRWDLGHGNVIEASAAPRYLGEESRVDPEQAFVAALSSCHALTFLALCALQKLTIDRYTDDAVGFLEKGPDGKPWLARVELHSVVVPGEGIELDRARLGELHERAHRECFLANSVRTEITTVLD